MKELKLHNLENKFLSPESQEIQKLAYYGKFLVLPEFDDGWKYQMQKQLLDYLASLDFSENEQIDLQVETEDTKQEIFAVLKAESLNEKTEKKVEEITKILQKKFFMTEVKQKVGFGKSDNSNIPLKLEDLESDDFGYERFVFQKQYAEILKIRQQLNDIEFYLNSKKGEEVDEIEQILLTNLEKLKETKKLELENYEEKLEGIKKNLYNTQFLKEVLGENKSTILTEKSTDLTFQNNSENAVNTAKQNKGVILLGTLDKDKCIVSATNALTGEKIYFDSEKQRTIGFNLDGLEVIDYIQPVETNEEKQAILIKVYIGETNYHYYFEDGEYKRLEIDKYYTNLVLRDCKLDEKTGKPLSGQLGINGSSSNNIRFWIEDGEYKVFGDELDDYIEAFICEKNEIGKPLYGYMTTGSYRYNNIIVFWLENGEYKLLDKVGKEKFFGNDKEIIRDENGKPLYGKVTINGRIEGRRMIKFLLDPETGEYRKKKMFEKIPEKYLQYAKK